MAEGAVQRSGPISFVKVEAAGNDLILIDARARRTEELPSVARRLCQRRFAIGSDGLLIIENAHDGLPLMRMFNPDGTEDFCGNALRCVAAWLFDIAKGSPEVTLRSTKGLHRAHVSRSGGGKFLVDVEVIPPEFRPELVPVRLPGERILGWPLQVAGEALSISCVAIGTTHTVIWRNSEVPEGVFQRISPLIEQHEIFPERTSVLWCWEGGPGRIRARIWERGAGETLACGTGACAAVVTGRALGLTGDSAEVVFRGGIMSAEWHGQGPVRLCGPARIVFRGQIR